MHIPKNGVSNVRQQFVLIMKLGKVSSSVNVKIVLMLSSFTCWEIHQSIHFQVQNTPR